MDHKQHTIELNECEIRQLMSGLGWMLSECGEDPSATELLEKLHNIVGPTEWEIRAAERAAGWDDQP